MTTPFHEMNDVERADWLRWANSHDWGAAPARWNADGSMHVEVAAFDRDNIAFTETLAATTPQQLRDWAGY